MTQTANPERTQELERQAWRLRMRFWSQQDIAQELGVSQETVSRMLHRVAERLNKAFLQEISCMRAEQTEQLTQIARTAYEAYEKCRQELPEETPSDPMPDALPVAADESNPPAPRRRANLGAAYLKVALRALADLRALWGLEAAKKADIRAQIPAVKALIGIDIERMRTGKGDPDEARNEAEYQPEPLPA